MKRYKNFKEVRNDLKMYDLQRKIAYQEILSAKNELEELSKPLNWIQPFLKTASKYGLLYLLKRFFKKN